MTVTIKYEHKLPLPRKQRSDLLRSSLPPAVSHSYQTCTVEQWTPKYKFYVSSMTAAW